MSVCNIQTDLLYRFSRYWRWLLISSDPKRYRAYKTRNLKSHNTQPLFFRTIHQFLRLIFITPLAHWENDTFSDLPPRSTALSPQSQPFPNPCSLRTAFTRYVDLTGAPGISLLAVCSHYATSQGDRDWLRLLSSNTEEGQVSGRWNPYYCSRFIWLNALYITFGGHTVKCYFISFKNK